MASINELGNVQANCVGCDGALSTFEWRHARGQWGAATVPTDQPRNVRDHRLFRCSGCGMGALGFVMRDASGYPGDWRTLEVFMPQAKARLSLPDAVPEGIKREFKEAQACLEHDCFRAAAGMFRSVLDKTLRANGYKEKRGTSLEQQIDAAAADGVITQARKKKAHDEIRVLGNDVLHDDWHEVSAADVEAARHYSQRILEDFYDDRSAVLSLLREAKRVPEEDRAANLDAALTRVTAQ